eukprot:13524704-Heterocapsa_arctica.AAC.1
MELIVYLEDLLQMSATGETMEQEETECTNITETGMSEAIKGIEKKMEQLEALHHKSDQMKEDLDRVGNIATTIRGLIAKWNRNEHTHNVGTELEELRAQVAMEEDGTGNVVWLPAGMDETPQQRMMAEDIQNIVSYGRWETAGAWRTGISRLQVGQLTQWMRSRDRTAVDI